MKSLNHYKHIYFLGIGGIGMSAIARHIISQGITVSGFDKTPSKVTEALASLGCTISYNQNLTEISPSVDLIIYTPAIPKDSVNYKLCLQHPAEMIKRSAALGIITANKKTIAVAGTHGKTTISTMIAHILHQSSLGCTAFLGGIASNYNSNYLDSNSDLFVVEADEYDRSFLSLHPDIAVITSLDADHLDIYGDQSVMQQNFAEFAQQIQPNGTLIIKSDLQLEVNHAGFNRITYNCNDTDAHFQVHNESQAGVTTNFEATYTNHKWCASLNLGGRHNMENALAAIAVCHLLGLSKTEIEAGIQSFKGIKRRFEIIHQTPQQTFIDDYAHHPTELKALLSAVRTHFPKKRLSVVFQPHLFSRTQDFAQEFAKALELADEQILLPIYPAREAPIEGVTSTIIYDQINSSNKRLIHYDELVAYINKSQPMLLVTAGAGDIDRLIQPLKNTLKHGEAKV